MKFLANYPTYLEVSYFFSPIGQVGTFCFWKFDRVDRTSWLARVR